MNSQLFFEFLVDSLLLVLYVSIVVVVVGGSFPLKLHLLLRARKLRLLIRNDFHCFTRHLHLLLLLRMILSLEAAAESVRCKVTQTIVLLLYDSLIGLIIILGQQRLDKVRLVRNIDTNTLTVYRVFYKLNIYLLVSCGLV